MRLSSSLSFSSPGGRTTPVSRSSYMDLKRPVSNWDHRPLSPRAPPTKSRSGSSCGSRPLTPSGRLDTYTGTIKVSIRPNPLTCSPNSRNWHIDEHTNVIENVQDGVSYNFDNVFSPAQELSNSDVYQRACSHLVKSFLDDGFNCTLFAYGMTGSGKTYSMRGEDHDPGFIRLAIDDIFAKINSTAISKKYEMTVSYLEIYNEKVIDLLGLGPLALANLQIRDDSDFGTKIIGINCPVILSKDDLLQLIKLGDAKRKTSSTDYNMRSSRSHAIVQIRLKTVDMVCNTSINSTLSLCDLAGSEKATLSVERRKEGAFINKSLLALSTVINKLSLMSTSNVMEHIPYRDSKLTRLLQPALSGSSLILILCTVHLGSSQPALNAQSVSETYNTLRFAARAKDIVMNVNTNRKVNLGDSDNQKIIDQLRETIESQKKEIYSLKVGIQSTPGEQQANQSLVAGLQAELKVQSDRIEHLTKLTDIQTMETMFLRNDVIKDILGGEAEKDLSQKMMANLEEFHGRVNYELEENRRYIEHLETQLKAVQLQALLHKTSQPLSNSNIERILQEQEEENAQLKETIKDKDQIIQSLMKTSKLRRLVEQNSNRTTESYKIPVKRASVSELESGKENVFSETRTSKH